jgi:hypothetical protein
MSGGGNHRQVQTTYLDLLTVYEWCRPATPHGVDGAHRSQRPFLKQVNRARVVRVAMSDQNQSHFRSHVLDLGQHSLDV